MSDRPAFAAMSDLEASLAQGDGLQVLDGIALKLATLTARLKQRELERLPASQFKDLEASLLAVRAATEVVCAVRPQGALSATNPYVDGKSFFRSTQSP